MQQEETNFSRKISKSKHSSVKLIGLILFVLCLSTFLLFKLLPENPIKPFLTIPEITSKTQAGCIICDSTESLLEKFQNDSLVGQPLHQMLNQVLGKMANYRKIIQRGYTYAYTDSIQIDIILQTHIDYSNLSVLNPEALASQKRIMVLTKHLEPDIFGWEGTDCDPLSEDAIIDLTIDFARKYQDFSLNRREVEQIFHECRKIDAMFNYITSENAKISIGVEDMDLFTAHHWMIDGISRQPNQAYVCLFDNLGMLRSEVAISKMIVKLHQMYSNHGVIIIGYLHKQELKKIIQMLGVKSNFYDTHHVR